MQKTRNQFFLLQLQETFLWSNITPDNVQTIDVKVKTTEKKSKSSGKGLDNK